MPPIPFPLPIGVGTDICHVVRLAHIASDAKQLNSWAKKVFSRLEWLAVYRELASGTNVANPTDNKLHLPPLNIQDGKVEFRSPESEKLKFLAGRWAAKEAAIKAHRQRRLFMSDVSIVAETKPSSKGIYALVDPPSTTVTLGENVAELRGLHQAYSHRSAAYQPDSRFGSYVYGSVRDGIFLKSGSSEGERIFTRRSRIKDEERRVAHVSISHDGEYATAICMAIDEPTPIKDGQSPIHDDGTGEAIHEPKWGDKGWLTFENEDQLRLVQ